MGNSLLRTNSCFSACLCACVRVCCGVYVCVCGVCVFDFVSGVSVSLACPEPALRHLLLNPLRTRPPPRPLTVCVCRLPSASSGLPSVVQRGGQAGSPLALTCSVVVCSGFPRRLCWCIHAHACSFARLMHAFPDCAVGCFRQVHKVDGILNLTSLRIGTVPFAVFFLPSLTPSPEASACRPTCEAPCVWPISHLHLQCTILPAGSQLLLLICGPVLRVGQSEERPRRGGQARASGRTEWRR